VPEGIEYVRMPLVEVERRAALRARKSGSGCALTGDEATAKRRRVCWPDILISEF